MSLDYDTLSKHQAELEQRRTTFDSWWQQICYRVLPAEATFTSMDSEGTKRTDRLFDSTAAKNNRKFAAITEDLITPRTQRWHGLEAENDELVEDQDTDEYFDTVTNVLFKMRYGTRAGFATARAKGYLTMGPIGNVVMFIDEVLGDGPRYISIPMREVSWAENEFGVIDVQYRKYCQTGRNALKRFGDQLSEKLRQEMKDKPFKLFDFMHCVRPNEERKPGRADYRGMEWSSYYLSIDDKSVVNESGFTSWPYSNSRYQVATGEIYARSPAMECWPAILTLQEQKKTLLRAGQKEVDPPLLLSEDGILGQFNLKSAALNYGALSSDGTPLVAPLKTGANIPAGIELMQIERADVDDSFLSSLWNMVANENIETAAQVYELARMRAINLAPLMSRVDSEDIGPMIHRELDIAAKMGLLPPMPRRLQEMGGGYKPVNTSPLAKLMRAQDGLAIVRTWESAGTAIALDKRAANVLKVPEQLRELAEINGVPAKLVRSLEEIEQIGQQQADAENAAAQAGVAPEISQAALNAAKAQQIRSGSPA
jgi:hypothetical protein